MAGSERHADIRPIAGGPTALRLVVRWVWLLATAVGLLLPIAADVARAQASGAVPVVAVDDPLTSARAGFVADAIRTAATDGAPAVLLRVEADAGTWLATRTVLDAIDGSPIPVLTWVPSGATVEGPGAAIVLAGHVATMAPDAGLVAGGTYGHTANPFDDDQPPQDPDAELTAITADRGRPTDWVAPTLGAGGTVGGVEALAAGAIDATATGPDEVLVAASGRTVDVSGGPTSVALAGATTATVDPGWGDRIWLFLAQPTVAYLLLCLGAIGLFLEISAPGLTIAGAGGLIALGGAVVILSTMPLNWLGLALVGGGLILLIIDIFVPSLGLLTIGGLTAFVVGSYVLFEGERGAGYAVAPAAIWTVTACLVVFFVVLAGSSLKGMRRRPASGREAMIGRVGVARTALAPEGMVFIDGELWRAHALTLHRSAVAPVIAAGAAVIVTRIDGLLLEVRAASKVEVEEAGIGDPTAVQVDRRTVVPVSGQPVE